MPSLIVDTPYGPTGVSGAELGYAEITANRSVTTTLADVTGLTVDVTVPVGVAGVFVQADLGAVLKDATAGYVGLNLLEDGTAIQATLHTITASGYASLRIARSRAPAAGAHTYKIQANTGAGGATITGNAGAGFLPFIRVITR